MSCPSCPPATDYYYSMMQNGNQTAAQAQKPNFHHASAVQKPMPSSQRASVGPGGMPGATPTAAQSRVMPQNPRAAMQHPNQNLVVFNPSVEDQDNIVLMPTENLNDPSLLAPSMLPSMDVPLLVSDREGSSGLVQLGFNGGPIVVQAPIGGNRRLARDIYVEDAYANPHHVDVPYAYQFTDAEKTWKAWNPWSGAYAPHPGLAEIHEAKELETLYQLQRIDDMEGGVRNKHDGVLDMLPGLIVDYRTGPNRHAMDFGGLDPQEIVDGESKLRLYSSYATTPGVGLEENSFQNQFF